MTKEWPKRLVTTEAAAKRADARWEKSRNRDVKR
jgi:hypothetical protein